MPPSPGLLRALSVVVMVATLTSCATLSHRRAASKLPSISSVVAARFVTRVELDNGELVVVPPGKVRAHVSASAARSMFDAADVVDGAYPFAVIGLGVVTISSELTTTTSSQPSAESTTIPSTGTGTPNAGTGAGSTTTTTTTTSLPAKPATVTTGLPTTTSTANPTTSSTAGSTASPGTEASSTTTITAPPTPTLPGYVGRLAWVGIAWGAGCPVHAEGSRLPTRYIAVVFDAQTGHSVIAYTSRGAASCGGPIEPPSVGRPTELLSVPWQPVGPNSTAVRVTMPACSTYFGWTDVANTGSTSVQVVAKTPFDPECGATTTSTLVVDDVVPLGSAQARVLHAALGPVDGLRTLPSG